ncbi:MAG: hypothetical protein HKL95_09065 [Phycisphaerae bacterium]|nr:hypothetical protein [Phycisphaerae bacterium]
MTLEEQILNLENQREMCLDELEVEIHAGMHHLRQRWSPVRFVRRHLVSSIATAGIAGILVPWLAAWRAGKAGPFGHASGKVEERRTNPGTSSDPPGSQADPEVSPRGSAGGLLSAVVRTAVVEVASRVDVPGLISRFFKKPEKPENPDENDG